MKLPRFGSHLHVAVASVVCDESTVAFVHLPVADKVRSRRLFGLVLVKQSHRSVVSFVPEGEFMDSALCGATADAEFALTFVSVCRSIVKESDCAAVLCVSCIEERLIACFIAEGEVNPLFASTFPAIHYKFFVTLRWKIKIYHNSTVFHDNPLLFFATQTLKSIIPQQRNVCSLP